MLTFCQILAQNLDNGWLVHVRGCATIIQARGPSRHFSEFEKYLLDAEEGFLVRQFAQHTLGNSNQHSVRSSTNQLHTFLPCIAGLAVSLVSSSSPKFAPRLVP